MLDVVKRIEVIEKLMTAGDLQSLTYAALECRLTIEHICYERLVYSQPYFSRADLKKWPPVQVVKQIAAEANALIATGFTLSISTTHTGDNPPKTAEEFAALEYVEIGQQAGFEIGKMHKLWNGLSNVALHVSMPSDSSAVSTYGSAEAINAKLIEAVAEFKKFKKGTLIGGSLSTQWSFQCSVCKTVIRRNADLIKDGQIISCFNPLCDESYEIRKIGDELSCICRQATFHCKVCNQPATFPSRRAEKLSVGDRITLTCEKCDAKTSVGPILVQEKVARHPAAK
jgi:hypothetical protein